MQIDRTGTFLVQELDRAVDKTRKAGLPQLTISVRILHWFDESLNNGDGEWVDFSEYFMETKAFCTLAYKDKQGDKLATFQHDHAMEVYGWDGKDYSDLATIASPETFQIRVKDNDPGYADKNPYVVDSIAPASADPRGGLKKLDADGLRALNVEFASVLNRKGKTAPPASAAKAPPKAPPVVLTTAPPKTAAPAAPAAPAATVPPSEDVTNSAPPKQTAAQKKAAKAAKSKHIAEENARIEAAKTKKAPPTPPTAPVTTPAPAEDTEEVTGSKTKQEAYEYVFEMQAVGVTDEQRNNAWNAAIKQIAGDVDQKTIIGEQWYQIMHETLNDVGAV